MNVSLTPELDSFVAGKVQGGRYNSAWLSMMYPRLELLREFLTEDGSIWVSVDDWEAHYIKTVLDEIIGRANFIIDVSWKKRDGAPNDRKIGSIHEHILVWSKSKKSTSKQTLAEESFNLMPRTAKADSQYQVFAEPDGPDSRGAFRKIDTTANGKGGRFVESLYYGITNPYSKVEVWPRKGTCWRHNKEEMERLQADHRLFWGAKGTAKTVAGQVDFPLLDRLAKPDFHPSPKYQRYPV